jgi:hypothetical protein
MYFLWHQRVVRLRNAGNCSAFSIRYTTQSNYKKKNLTVFQKNNSEKLWTRFGSTHKNTKIFSINQRSYFIYGTREDDHRTKQNILYQFTYVAKKKQKKNKTSQFSHSCIKVVFLFFFLCHMNQKPTQCSLSTTVTIQT